MVLIVYHYLVELLKNIFIQSNTQIEDCELKLKPNHVVIFGRQVHIKNIPFEEYILKSKPINKLPRGKHFKNRVGKPMPLVIFDELNYKPLSF